MHRVIPSARNLFDQVNADGSIPRYSFKGPIDPQEVHNRREAEAMPRYVDVIRGDATIRSAEEPNRRRFFDSALYNEIWRPQRLRYQLEVIVRGRDAWPREQGEGIFCQAGEEAGA